MLKYIRILFIELWQIFFPKHHQSVHIIICLHLFGIEQKLLKFA